ncbi:MAG: vWA domain-containing protein, partial [Gammaproteobacteria bacterium]
MPAGASVSPRRSRRRLPRWALLAAASSCGIHAATLTEHIEIACSQAPATVLRCDYRLPDGGALRSAVAEHAGKVIAGDDVAPYPQPGDTTAVLILVDTSDPARQPVIDRIKQQVATFAAAAGPHHALALASFDTDLHLLAEPGTSAAEITRAARSLEATGRTTELYRNVRDAVRLLGRARHSRRTLVILSDGLAEDYAYHHEDVVELALELGVTIHSIGYPRSVAQSVALQTIRRLSDETGGMYVQAAHLDYSIPDGVFARMLAASDSGGTLEFDLDALIDAGATGALDLSLAFQTERQSFIVLAPVRLPKTAAPASAAEPPAAPLPAPLAPALGTRPRIAPPADRAPALWPWFAVLTVLTLLVL